MKISRRNMLLGTFSTIAFASVSNLNQAKAAITIATNDKDKKLIATMCRALYPHDKFPEKIYLDVAAGAIKKGNANPGNAMMLKVGLDTLKSNSFAKMNFAKKTKYLKKIEGSDFFNHVRGHTTVALYDHKEVWKILGYEGSSFQKGGYKKGQYDDLKWLPEPRVTEHPQLASFLGTKNTEFANISTKLKIN